MKRTITVTGRGEITLCPDTAKLTMELREEGAEHAAVTAACGARAGVLPAALGKGGLAGSFSHLTPPTETPWLSFGGAPSF